MKKQNKRFCGLLLLLWTLAASSVAALAEDTGRLSQLKPTVPGTITLTRADGTVVGKDVPVYLPEGDALPVLQVRYAKFDIPAMKKVYGNIDQNTNLNVLPFHPLIHREPKQGVTQQWVEPKYTPDSLMALREHELGGVAPHCAVQPERPLALAQEMLALGGVSADLRVYKQFAQGPAYLVKDHPGFHTGNGFVPEDEVSIDFDRPLKPYDRGLYWAVLAQYVDGARIFGDYTYVLEDAAPQDRFFFTYFNNFAVMAAEDDFNIGLAIAEPTEILLADTALAPLDTILATLQERMDAGKLQQVYEITLGYTPMNLSSAPAVLDQTLGDQRYVLRPCWQVRCYDTLFESMLTQHGRTDTTLTAWDYAMAYDLRIDAITGELITTHDQLSYRDQ